MKNILAPNFLLAFAAAALLTACGGNPPSRDKSAKLADLMEQKNKIEAEITALQAELGVESGAPQRIRKVGLDEIKTETFRHYIDLQGRVEAEDNVPATAKMPGMLTRVLVKNGSTVKAGQLLAELDDQIMQKSLAELELQLATAEDVFQRQKGLWDQKIGTEIQFIQARTQKEAFEKSIATVKEQLKQTKIYAPISGTVDMVILKAGQAISPGIPLCNIINLSDLKIKGNVPESYAAKVRKGDEVLVYFPDLDKEVRSRISYVSQSIDPNTRTFLVEALLPQGRDYRANMIAVLRIVDYQNPKAIVVPVNVIQSAEDGEFVLLAEKQEDGKAIARKVLVTQGSTYNGKTEITQGLKPGDLYIATGYQDVNNGETIAF